MCVNIQNRETFYTFMHEALLLYTYNWFKNIFSVQGIIPGLYISVLLAEQTCTPGTENKCVSGASCKTNACTCGAAYAVQTDKTCSKNSTLSHCLNRRMLLYVCLCERETEGEKEKRQRKSVCLVDVLLFTNLNHLFFQCLC